MYPSRGFILAVVILLRCRDSTTLRPDITAEADEIIKNEGDPLEITCSGTKKLFFIYPESGELFNTSMPSINGSQVDAGTYRYEFRRPETVHGDTGWYGCADHAVEVTHDSYFDPDISWVYVYVQSNTSLFVEQDIFFGLREAIGRTTTIPCRPTSPNLTVQIASEDTFQVLDSDRLAFDPRFGFTLANLTLRDTGYLKCVIEKDGTSREVNYHLYVLRRQTLNEPKILEDTLRHVTRGQTLRVNCTIDVEADLHYVLFWKTPQNDSRISTYRSSAEYGANIQRATAELVINGVLDEDEGLYECVISSFYDTKKSEKYIKVHG